MRRIAVIGATGMLGVPVVTQLVEAGFEVTALVRNPPSAKQLLPQRTKVAKADVADIESLKLGFRGHDAIYLNLSIAPNERKDDFHTEAKGLENILAAARFAGIKRIAYLSAMVQESNAGGWWVIEVWRKAISQIKNSGIAYTIFYPTTFMETLPQRHVKCRILLLTGTARYPNYWIAGRDYGMQVARSFQIAEAANRDYFVQGPEPLTYDEAAYRFAKSFKKRLLIVKIPLPLLKYLGVFSRAAHFSAQMTDTILKYPETFSSQITWDELGKPSTSIDDFASRL